MAIKRRSVVAPPLSDETVASDMRTTFEKLGVPPDKVRVFGLAVANAGDLPLPKEMPVQDLLALAQACDMGDNVETVYRARIRSPLTAIRAFCVLCKGGSITQATNCGETACALWAFRRGKNPFFGRVRGDNAEASD